MLKGFWRDWLAQVLVLVLWSALAGTLFALSSGLIVYVARNQQA